MHDGLDGLGGLDEVFWDDKLSRGLLLREAEGRSLKPGLVLHLSICMAACLTDSCVRTAGGVSL